MRLFLLLFAFGSLWAQDQFMTRIRQVTFEGKRAGESYFHPSGQKMVFQSERDADNPFYQIFMLDLITGSTQRISPGIGKTTCSWFHPTEKRILFASTHKDPDTQKLMKAELDFRASGQTRRYSWDYDPHFDLFTTDYAGGYEKQLTNQFGYDAEGSFSPDGKLIIYASNYHAYSEKLSDADQKKLKMDPSYFIDLYSLVPGQEPKRLTNMPGYDGGPFFSPDGHRVCFRHFSEDGATAEIWTMNVDGSDQKAITQLGAMSWAPYYHPTGSYLIFTTNLQGFANFELYLVDPQGRKKPVRVTYTDGFDGLPVFFPSGDKLAWTTNRAANGSSQIFFANWDHAAALAALEQAETNPAPVLEKKPATSNDPLQKSELDRHIRTLAQPDWQGRLTGSEGERKAGDYLAQSFKELGLVPLPDQDNYFDEFEFASGVSLEAGNTLSWDKKLGKVDADWRPVTLSKSGTFEGEAVFAGYGLSLEKSGDQEGYDSYVHLDVKDKWVVLFRYLPENVSDSRRDFLRRLSTLREKVFVARQKGAIGVIVISGPNSGVKESLIALKGSGMAGGAGIAVISVSDQWVADRFSAVGKDLKAIQDQLDQGELMQGFSLGQVSASIALKTEKGTGRNVLARLGVQSDLPPILIGAHYDHLGDGSGGNSLAREEEKGQPHVGADDNASGTAGVLALAGWLQQHRSELKRDVWFGAWSGEELGLLGSTHFAEKLAGPHGDLSGKLAAYLNMDMIGRLKDNLIVQGLGSSSVWAGLIEQVNVAIGLPLQTSEDCFLPTDATAFYVKKVPILNVFTGAHEDYHTPRDTPDKIDLDGVHDIVSFMGSVALRLASQIEGLDYKEHSPPKNRASRGFRVYLGTIPDYAQSDSGGVKLSGVSKGGPAEQAGIQGGDILVELAGTAIENIYDYTHILERLKVGQSTTVKVKRQDEILTLTLTPGSRD